MALVERLARAGFCFLVWISVDVLRHRIGGQEWGGLAGLFALTTLASLVYLIYYIVSERLYEEIIGNILVSLVLMGLTAIFPLFGILLVLWVLYNVQVTLRSIVSLLPLALISMTAVLILFPLLWGDLLGESIFSIVRPLVYVGPILGDRYEASVSFLDLGFLAIGAVHSWVVSASPLKHAFARLALLGGSVGLIVLSVCAIIEGLRNVFRHDWVSSTRRVTSPEYVSAHFREGGRVFVHDYERQVTRSVVSTVAVRSVGSGGLTAAGVGASMHAVDSTIGSDSAGTPTHLPPKPRRWWSRGSGEHSPRLPEKQ